MNEIDFPYVVLRNWEGLPDQATIKGHGDLDLLVYDLKHFREIFPKILPTERERWRVRHKLTIGENNIYMDVRSVGDGYYPAHFQRNILETREWNKNGFYTPNPVHFRIALAYHAVHHKNFNQYTKFLGPAKIPDILESLKKSNVGYTDCSDYTVGRFHPYWKGATAIVSKEGERMVKKQVGWDGYNLVENERRILALCDSKHFPKIYDSRCGEPVTDIEIENCGIRLSVKNLPENWKEQLVEILHDLKKYGIQHRDIRPDNLMVKDGVIKLIDFGWARLHSDPDDSPPSVLGIPYKPSHGFDDNFSMRKVIKELEFKLEEGK